MSRSVSLIDWTDRGVSDFKATVDRAEGAREAAKQLGGDYEVYWTMGQHDLVVVAEFPDDESATAFLLKLGSMGNVRSKSMRAFIAAEMRDIIGRAGRRSNAWTDAELNGGLLGLQPRSRSRREGTGPTRFLRLVSRPPASFVSAHHQIDGLPRRRRRLFEGREVWVFYRAGGVRISFGVCVVRHVGRRIGRDASSVPGVELRSTVPARAVGRSQRRRISSVGSVGPRSHWSSQIHRLLIREDYRSMIAPPVRSRSAVSSRSCSPISSASRRCPKAATPKRSENYCRVTLRLVASSSLAMAAP